MEIKEIFNIIKLMFYKPKEAIARINKLKRVDYLVIAFVASVVVLQLIFVLAHEEIIPSLLSTEEALIRINFNVLTFLTMLLVNIVIVAISYFTFGTLVYLLEKLTKEKSKFQPTLVSSNIFSLEIMITLLLTTLLFFVNDYFAFGILIIGIGYYVYLIYNYLTERVEIDKVTLFFISLTSVIVFATIALTILFGLI